MGFKLLDSFSKMESFSNKHNEWWYEVYLLKSLTSLSYACIVNNLNHTFFFLISVLRKF